MMHTTSDTETDIVTGTLNPINRKRKVIPFQAWTDPCGSRRVRLPEFKRIGTWRLCGFQLNALAAFTPQQIFLIVVSVTGLVEPRATVRPEGLCKWKIPMTPSGIEAATFRLVAQCLNQLRHFVPQWIKNSLQFRHTPYISLRSCLSSLDRIEANGRISSE
jgi:hypothetical protein